MRESEFRQAIGARAPDTSHPRLFVYRNNLAVGLATALAVRYPMVQRLLGDVAFTRVANDFAAAGHLPESPVLIDYGAGFPAFCQTHPALAQYPFLADLALLESRWWQVYHAAEAEPLAPAEFALAADALDGLRFVLHPAVGMLTTQWPAGTIWQTLHEGGSVADTSPATQHILIRRPVAEVHVEILAPARAAFLRSLMTGASLAESVAAVPDLDPEPEFAALIAAQLIIRLDRTS